jgi:hypothetical protein
MYVSRKVNEVKEDGANAATKKGEEVKVYAETNINNLDDANEFLDEASLFEEQKQA